MLNVLMFFSTYGAGFYASLFRNPVYAFVLYEAVYFFYPRGRWWGSMVPDISYSFFVVVLMLGLVVLNYRQLKQNKLLEAPPFRWMYAFLALFGIAYFYAVHPESHYSSSIYFLKMVIIVSAAYKLCDTDAKLDLLLYGYILGAWYIGFVGYQVGRNSGDRLEGVGTVDAPDANDIAAAIAPCIVLCLYYFWTNNKWWGKGLAAVAGVFIANGLILINSRGAFLAAIVSVAIFMYHMYFSSLQRKAQKSIAVFITIAGLAGTASLIDTAAFERFASMSESEVNEEQESGSTRTVFWEAAWDMAKDHPFGAGHLGFNYYSPDYIPEGINTGGSRHRSVHSSWFEALSETGYLGLIAFMLMLYSAYRALGKCKKTLREQARADEYFKVVALQAALIGFIVAMTFINRMRAEILYWLILYAACAYNIYVLKVQSENKESP